MEVCQNISVEDLNRHFFKDDISSCQPEQLLSERQQVTSFGEDTERRERLGTVAEGKNDQPLWKIVWGLLKS